MSLQYGENEYVQLGACNFEIMNDYTYLGAFYVHGSVHRESVSIIVQ